MILLIDNYDSFVFNLARYVSELNYEPIVKRNDAISLQEIKYINPSHIIISPGPCTPNEAGIALKIVKNFANQIPILGICLGHQVIAQAFGGQIIRAEKTVHGKNSLISHCNKKIFNGIKNPLKVGRYHSLIVNKKNFPEQLEITAESAEGEIMALMHRDFHIYGVQFHPESILTEEGHKLLQNFIENK